MEILLQEPAFEAGIGGDAFLKCDADLMLKITVLAIQNALGMT